MSDLHLHFKKHSILETRSPSIAEKVNLQTDVLANNVHLINLIVSSLLVSGSGEEKEEAEG